MGLEIERENFSEDDFQRYSRRLFECLKALKRQIREPGFGLAPGKIGAELESYLVDPEGRVLPINRDIIQRANNPRLTVELNKFNLEINFDPIVLSAYAFSEMEAQMDQNLSDLRWVAAGLGAEVVPIGILPTLEGRHLSRDFMTDAIRYRVLSDTLRRMRGEDFRIQINGVDELSLVCDHVALEGANTSFQFHMMVPPSDFADLFNAIQLTTPLVLAVSANSPLLLDKLLWDETRIALFKQSIDSRHTRAVQWHQPSRVSFGHGWVREDAYELFAESVALYAPIFPLLSAQNPLRALDSGQVPGLDELVLHTGTTWPWNRPVYSAAEGGHLRVEMRSLPAGPTNRDMCAGAALAVGLAWGLKSQIRELLAVMPFRFAEHNFYRAAQHGLSAELVWTEPKRHKAVAVSVLALLDSLLPVAEQGLRSLGLAEAEIKAYLGVIERRLQQRKNGAIWQKHTLAHFERRHNRHRACRQMFALYQQQQLSGLPLCDWEWL